MRFLIVCCVFLGFMAQASASDFQDLESTKALLHNSMLKQFSQTEIGFSYNEKDGSLLIVVPEAVITTAYMLPNSGVIELRKALKKFFEWEEKAMEMKVEIKKPILDVPIVSAFYKYGNGKMEASRVPYVVTAHFFSQSNERHQFVLDVPRIAGALSHQGENVYFDTEHVKALSNKISEEGLKSEITSIAKQKEIESQFN